MNKKTVAMALAIMFAFAANAAKEYVDGYTWEYTVSGGAATVTGVEPIQGDAVIPSTLGGYPVRAVGSSFLDWKTGFSSVRIPDGVTTIGSYAFYFAYCIVEIPSSVTYIGDLAFWTSSAKWHVKSPVSLYGSSSSSPFGGNGYYFEIDAECDVWGGLQQRSDSLNRHLKRFRCKRQYAKNWIAAFGCDKFAGYIDDVPEVEIVSSAVRENDPTVMDVVYKVYSDKAQVKVRALAFQDGQRNLAKAVPVKTLIEGTGANIGDSIAANVEHRLSWKVAADWATDLAKVKFEVLAVEDDLLPLELQTIPATANHAAMKISWNRLTDDKVFDALLWLYADGDTGLTLTNGQLKNGGTILASGTGISNGQSAVTYVFEKMGYGVLSGSDLTYARRVAQLDLPVSGVQQYAVKMLAQ